MLFLLLIFLGCLCIFLFLSNKINTHFPDSFPNENNRKKIDFSKPRIVCFGDSITHGIVSDDWVSKLQSEFPAYQFINAGKNSDLTYTLLNRIDDVIACKPDLITILIGTNDINATTSETALKRYRTGKKIDKETVPNFEAYKANLAEIVSILKSKTTAKIAIASLPLMGEDLTNEPNQKANQYADFIEHVAHNEGLTFLPLREKMVELLNPNLPAIPFKNYIQQVYFSVILHETLGWSWNKITAFNKNQLSPDMIHLNETSGDILKNLVKTFISNNLKPKT